jgi:hypothetical protein
VLRGEPHTTHNRVMRKRVLSAVLFAALVATPVWARKSGHGSGHSSSGTHSSTAAHSSPSHVANSSSPRVSGSGTGGTVPETSSGYHSSAGYGSAYGWGYNDWTHNGYHDGQWHGIPYSSGTSQASQSTMRYGGSKASSTSASEAELIQQQVAARRAQQAQGNSQTSQPATTATSPQKP